MSVTLAQRAQAYEVAFGAKCTSTVWVAGGGRWLYGHWEIGAHYRNATRFYGAYPPTFLERVMALFFEIRESQVLHAFSGSLPPGDYLRLDMRGELQPDIVGNVYDARRILRRYRRRIHLVIADPPYSEADAEKYFTPMVDRRRAIAAIGAAVAPGTYMAWLDQVKPMYRADRWHFFGVMAVHRSTNHRARNLYLFERVSA